MSLDDNTRIETYSGRLFDFAEPQVEQVDIGDIAHALSLICRYGGHIDRAYSVAQHALLVRRLIVHHFQRPDLGWAGLHHDSPEAYTGDVMRPMKVAMAARHAVTKDAFAKIDAMVESVVAEYLGIPLEELHDPVVKEADVLALRMEASVLKVNDGRTFAEAAGVEPAPPIDGIAVLRLPPEVEHDFLDAHQAEVERRIP